MHRDGTIERVMRKYMGQLITKEILDELVHALVQENYMNRSQQARLTGEWIIFAKTAAGNVYLTLASHQEGDKQIADRLGVYRMLGLIEPTDKQLSSG
jgi:hypothetical protein